MLGGPQSALMGLCLLCAPTRQAVNKAGLHKWGSCCHHHKDILLGNFEREANCTALPPPARQICANIPRPQVDTGLTDTGSTMGSFAHRRSGPGSTLGTKAFVRLWHKDLVVSKCLWTSSVVSVETDVTVWLESIGSSSHPVTTLLSQFWRRLSHQNITGNAGGLKKPLGSACQLLMFKCLKSDPPEVLWTCHGWGGREAAR